jgi:hypothetical protein
MTVADQTPPAVAAAAPPVGWAPVPRVNLLPPEILEARGFDLVRDVSTAAAARELMPPDLAAQVTRDDSHVALARPTAGLS